MAQETSELQIHVLIVPPISISAAHFANHVTKKCLMYIYSLKELASSSNILQNMLEQIYTRAAKSLELSVHHLIPGEELLTAWYRNTPKQSSGQKAVKKKKKCNKGKHSNSWPSYKPTSQMVLSEHKLSYGASKKHFNMRKVHLQAVSAQLLMSQISTLLPVQQ